ncbi:MAG: hypothetical protein MJZ05_10365 [Fibrobacter sp.]|nr:hypothetical protein [Fibrobacter sp.]MCQ2109151.1 hypothetical protein [Fibrobacter sp.]MCQ2124161.1 hypothetical protein [Fibrobacter sp.]MCQ2124173.1 hypothetical protein [Fibrobacter sp.]
MKPISEMLNRQQNKITNREAVERIHSDSMPKTTLKEVEVKLPNYTR